MLVLAKDVAGILACPRCRSALDYGSDDGTAVTCSDGACGLSKTPFLCVGSQPVLADFESSILDRDAFRATSGASTIRRDPGRASILTRIKQAARGVNASALHFAKQMLTDLRRDAAEPLVLVVGGGEIGSGADLIYQSVRVLGTDIYASPNTSIVADGHRIPLKDGSVDAVWIQAVLEHVLDPHIVVAEIHRVLKPAGLVYADTPFMQQVHEGPFDFTRFTVSGHRWLFRNFTLIDAGYTGGPGTALRWSLSYFFRSLLKSPKAGAGAALAFSWLRVFDRLPASRFAADASSGTFFYGRKAATAIGPREIVAFYGEQRELAARRR